MSLWGALSFFGFQIGTWFLFVLLVICYCISCYLLFADIAFMSISALLFVIAVIISCCYCYLLVYYLLLLLLYISFYGSSSSYAPKELNKEIIPEKVDIVNVIWHTFGLLFFRTLMAVLYSQIAQFVCLFFNKLSKQFGLY